MDKGFQKASLQERRRVERQYRQMLKNADREIHAAVEGLTDPDEIIHVLKNLAQSPKYKALCTQIAKKMASTMAVGEHATWRKAAAASVRGKMIYKELMRELSDTGRGAVLSDIALKNAELIRTVPSTMANEFSLLATKRRLEGVRPDQIAQEMLRKAPHLTVSQAKTIARTESAKASTALVEARATSRGYDLYIWSSSKDGDRVRKSHRLMHGVICRWSDPPDPEALAGEKSYGNYHPGGIFNCRCIPLPIMFLRDIQFPAKAHINGRIVTVSSVEALKKLFNIQDAKGG